MIGRPHVTHLATVRTGLSLVFEEALVDQDRQACAYEAPDYRLPPPCRLGRCLKCHVGIQVTMESEFKRLESESGGALVILFGTMLMLEIYMTTTMVLMMVMLY